MPQQRPVRAHVDIEVRPGFTADHIAVIRNISLSGCLLVTRAKLKQSQQLSLGIPVEGGGEIHVPGAVVRLHSEGAGGWDEYGVSFDPVSEENRRALALVVAGGVDLAP